ncbi:response regulator [Microbacterium halotolerans]|uniref:response regulator n=1 Tax=Microbacterium halotolerans TaxID=246613 RepID=UPI0023E12A06|nr:response regulator transcription factor [Microbacterium halotolerans]
MISVLITDDQESIRAGLRMMLDAQPDIEVVGEAADGIVAVDLARRQRPDVVLMDIRMPRMDGLEATRALAADDAPPAVVILTTFDLDEYVHGALRAGAKGFLLKDSGPRLLAEAVRAAATGDALIAPEITARLLAEFAPAAPRSAEPAEPLTSREEEVLVALAAGFTNAEIGAQLNLSLGTVKAHIAAVLGKLGVRNRVEAAMWAYESGRVRGSRHGTG